MIIGLGIDMVDIDRIRSTYAKNNAFAKKICTDKELDRLKQTSNNFNAKLAKIWAAKEALSKALGVGISKNFAFLDASLTNSPSGKPVLELSHKCQSYIRTTLTQGQDFKVDISICYKVEICFCVKTDTVFCINIKFTVTAHFDPSSASTIVDID